MQSSGSDSLLQGLQEKARAGLQATAQIMRERASSASEAAKERVEIARDGKKLLDEGGESVTQALIAKDASQAAADMDQSIATRVHVAVVKLGDSVDKLRLVAPVQNAGKTNTYCQFSRLAEEHEARLEMCRQIALLLESRASLAAMSPEESDALAIVQAKAGLGGVKQKALAGMASIYASSRSISDVGAHEPFSADTTNAPTLLEGLHERARLALHTAKETASNRVETARAGKKLLNDGGESIARVVVAKKASLDAAEIDRDVAQRVKSAILMFDDSAAKLKASSWRPHTNLTVLAEEHEMRANTYRQISSLLEAPIASLEMSSDEWDALFLVKVNDGCASLQCRTNEGFEAVKSMIFPSCADQANQGTQSRRIVCASVCA